MNAIPEASFPLLDTLRQRRTVHDFLPGTPPQALVHSG